VRIDLARLAHLIRRLSSTFDGEVIATVCAIRRVLGASGHDLHDLAKIVEQGPVTEKPSQQENAKQNERKERTKREWWPDEIIENAERLLQASWLSDWERGFLQSISEQASRRYGFTLSEKQQAKFDMLLRKDVEMASR